MYEKLEKKYFEALYNEDIGERFAISMCSLLVLEKVNTLGESR